MPKRHGHTPPVIQVPGQSNAAEVVLSTGSSIVETEAIEVPDCECIINNFGWQFLPFPAGSKFFFTNTAATGTVGAASGTDLNAPFATFIWLAGFDDESQICAGNYVEWSWTWLDEFGGSDKPPAILTGPKELIVYAERTYIGGTCDPLVDFQSINAGVLTVNAEVCGEDYGPITLTLALDSSGGSGSGS